MRARISLPRVSQIQTEIEKGRMSERLRTLDGHYKVKA